MGGREPTLASVLFELIPPRSTQLAHSQNLDVRPESSLSEGLRDYTYSFTADSRYRYYFEPVKGWNVLSTTPDRDDFPASIEDGREDDETANEASSDRLWSLSAAQARAGDHGLPAEYSRARKGQPCGYVFLEGETVYRCKECSLDDSCVMCARCFKASNHHGHEISISIHSGCGCCDCGDHEAWKQEITCAYHNPRIPYPATSSLAQDDAELSSPPEVPESLRLLVQHRIKEARDFIIDALESFTYTTSAPSSPLAIHKLEPNYPPGLEGVLKSSGEQRGPWAVILWNDEKHTYDHVVDQLRYTTGCSRSHAIATAVRVDVYGLDVIAVSSSTTRLCEIAKSMASIELGVTVCYVHEVVLLETVGLLLGWLKDMAKVKIRGNGNIVGSWIGSILLESGKMAKILAMEHRLWKKARSTLRHILMSMISVGYKLELATEYASVYPHLVSTYLLTDREPDNSVTQFSVQLFSAPSISTFLVKEKRFLFTVLGVLYSFFTQQHTVNGQEKIAFPPSSQHPPVDPDSSSFKHKKYFHIFQDMNYLLSHPSVQAEILQDSDFHNAIIDFLSLFSGMNTHTRASTTHVEYESETWVKAFNLTIQLSKLASSVGKAVSKASRALDDVTNFLEFVQSCIVRSRTMSLRNGVGELRTRTVLWASKTWEVIDYQISKQPVSFHHPVHLLLAEILKNTSGWTTKAIGKFGNVSGRSLGLLSGAIGEEKERTLAVSMIVEEPLRVFSLLAQIRTGLWVRNGFGLRAQQLHYREYNLREYTFDQDVYLLQAAFVAAEPAYLLVSMIDRMELWPVFAAEISPLRPSPNEAFDNQQLTSLLEEFLNLLVIIFSETTDIEELTSEQVVRRELAHCLLLGPYTYSEILKNVTERVSGETCFEKILSEVATFRPPDLSVATSDVGGMYTLKKELYEEIDPYNYRFTRNQREEAFKILKSHFNHYEFLKPHKLKLCGAFEEDRTFTSALCVPEFMLIIRQALKFATGTAGNYADNVIDLSLRLLSIAVVEVGGDAVDAMVTAGLVNPLCALATDDSAKDLHTKITFVLDNIATFRPTEVAVYRQGSSNGLSGDGVTSNRPSSQASMLEQKKLAAKARQAAIMQQFAAAQQSFLDANDTDDEDDSFMSIPQRQELSNDNPDMSDTLPETLQSSHKSQLGTTNMGSCILCQEEFTIQKPFGSLALIQTSSLIRRCPSSDTPFYQELYEIPANLDADAEDIRPFGVAGRPTEEREGRGGTSYGFPRSPIKGLHASACGHMMHVSCFETYCSSIAQRHSLQLTRTHPEDRERKEYVCPLCKSLGNVLLPLSEDDYGEAAPPPPGNFCITDDWLKSAVEVTSHTNPQLRHALSMLNRNGTGNLRAWKISDTLPDATFISALAQIQPAERHMLERLVQVVTPLDAECRLDDTEGEERGARVISHELVGYTIAALEIGLRGKATGTLSGDALPEASTKLVRSLLSALEKFTILNSGMPRGADTARLAILWLIFGQRSSSTNHQHFLNRDPFTILVETASVSPDEFYQFAAIAFYAHLLRVSWKLYAEAPDHGTKHPEWGTHVEALAEFSYDLQMMRWTRFHETIDETKTARARQAANLLYAHALPFLRRAAILHGCLFPSFKPSQSDESTELTRLMKMLRIPQPRELFGRRHGKASDRTLSLSALLETWDTAWLQPLNRLVNPEAALQVDLEHPVIYELLGLPTNFDILLESTVTRKCQICRHVPPTPAICLLCGELVCQGNFCTHSQDDVSADPHGECNTHMWDCGTSSGIFLSVKKCALIYLYADKGTYAIAPYLDVHGEPDLDLRKHRPLYLNKARYNEIRKLWLQHSIATVVARRLEASNDTGGWNLF